MSYLEGYNGAQGAPFMHPGYLPGRWYSTQNGQINSGTAVPAVDTIYLYPFVIPSRVTITGLIGRVSTGGTGSSMKTAIWANGAGQPNGAPLLVDNTGVATTSSNANVLPAATGTLNPGVYWMGTKHTGTLPQFVNIASLNQWMLWLVGAGSVSAIVNGLTFADSYSNNMPTFTSGSTFGQTGAGGIPLINFAT